MEYYIKNDRLGFERIKSIEEILLNVPIGIFRTTGDGTFLSVNQYMVGMLGYDSVDELIKTPVIDLYFDKKDREKLLKNLEQNGEMRGYEIKLRKKNGEEVWANITERMVKPEGDNVTLIDGILEDVTLRKNSEFQIARLATLIHQAADSIVLTDVNGNIEYVNPFFANHTGYSLEEVKGKNPRILKSPNADYPKKYFKYMWDTIKSGNIWKGQFTNIKKNGEEYIEEATIFPIKYGSGDVIGFGAIKKDITMRVEMEKELELTYNEMNAQKNRAEEAARFKSEFLANMSHDMKTPLNAIMGFADLLSGTGLDEKQRKFVRNIRSSGNILVNLINNILDVSKIESGKLEMDYRPFPVNNIVDELNTLFGYQFEKKGVDLIIKRDKSLPDILIGDIKRIMQVVTNIISNSLKFTAKGKVVMNMEYKEEAGILNLSVKDTGIGIKKENQRKIFDPFFSDKSSSVLNSTGTGLGLVIAKDLVDLMNGEIHFESGFGHGTTFFIKIPLKKDKNKKDAKAKIENEKFAFLKDDIGSYSHMKILVAEDDILNRELLDEIFKLRGFKSVKFVGDGEEAVKSAFTYKPDLIILDNKMPKKTGTEAIPEIRKSEPDIPIILLTADFKIDKEADMLLIADSLLAKPIDFDLLFNEMCRLFRQKDKTGKKYENDSTKRDFPAKEKDTKKSGVPLESIKNVFLKDLGEKCDFLKNIVSESEVEKNIEEISRIAHTLKGNAWYLDLKELGLSAEKLDKAIKEETSMENITELTEKLKICIREAIETIKNPDGHR